VGETYTKHGGEMRTVFSQNLGDPGIEQKDNIKMDGNK
jgi:hypothetical protein